MFWTRLMSGIILVIIALFTFSIGGVVLAALLLAISIVAYGELTKAMGVHTPGKEGNSLEVLGVGMIIVYYIVTYITKTEKYSFMIIIAALVFYMFCYVFKFPKYRAEQVMTAFFSFVYAPVMLSFIYLTRELPFGSYMVWMILLSSWGCDTCAYVVGMSFGKTIGNHKIFPKLSPKKSLEGCIGGVLGAMLCSALYGYFIVEKVIPDQNVAIVLAIIGGAGSVISQIGDLAASAIKRNHNIKDYGKLIPGHGGIMDRFDSVIFTAPIIYFLTMMLIQA